MKKETRIEKLKQYLVDNINTISNENCNINVYMLEKEIGNYSLDKIPEKTEVKNWIIGTTINQDVYSLRCKTSYSIEEMENLKNVGFFEKFESLIKSNNEKGDLPEIPGIESIECLIPGTMVSADTKEAQFEITIKITYRNEV